MQTLREAWYESMAAYCKDNGLLALYFDHIVEAYNREGRYYHTMTHLEHLFNYYLMFKSEYDHPDVLLWTLLYHDIVYETGLDARNEENSAIEADEQLQRLGVPGHLIDQVQAIILDTRHHNLDLSAHLEDAAWFMDMDLSILGAGEELYDQYTARIRQEYKQYPDTIYQHARIKTLRKFLARPYIYNTKYFYQKMEYSSRYNIEREIYLLEEKFRQN